MRLPQAAASLTLTTALSIVPLLAVAFATFQRFPTFKPLAVAIEQHLLKSLLPLDLAGAVLKYLHQFAANANGLTLVGSLFVLAGAVMMLLTVGDLVFEVHLSVEKIPALIATAMLGSAAFATLAYALSTQIRSADAAQPIVQAIMVPLYFVSGVFVPSVNLPGSLQTIAEIFPVKHLADGLHHALEPGVAGSGGFSR